MNEFVQNFLVSLQLFGA